MSFSTLPGFSFELVYGVRANGQTWQSALGHGCTFQDCFRTEEGIRRESRPQEILPGSKEALKMSTTKLAYLKCFGLGISTEIKRIVIGIVAVGGCLCVLSCLSFIKMGDLPGPFPRDPILSVVTYELL